MPFVLAFPLAGYGKARWAGRNFIVRLLINGVPLRAARTKLAALF